MKLDKKKLILICAVAAVIIAAIVLIFVFVIDKSVETTVPAKYNDGYAEKYASGKTVADDGSVTYEFDSEQYDKFLVDYQEAMKEESREELTTPHQYTHYNLKDSGDKDNYGIVVGISSADYEKIGEEKLKAEAAELAQAAIKYQMNTEDPADIIPVTYRDASTGNVYFTVEVPVA